MMKKIILSLSFAGAVFAISGCCAKPEHSAATSYCKLNKASESCQSCCLSQKAASSSFSGNACKCYK